MASSKPTGPEIIDEMIKKPTLDKFFDRNLRAEPLTDDELKALIKHYREERALFMEKESDK